MVLSEILNYISIIIITLLVGYLLAYSIIKTIDDRLTDISINMPQIVLPSGIPVASNYNYAEAIVQKGGSSINNRICDLSRRGKNSEILGSSSGPVQKTSNSEQILSYYINPSVMTSDQVKRFKLKAKVHKMTIIDYRRWLKLFKNDPENLDDIHRNNLDTLLSGKQINKIDIPIAPLEILQSKLTH